MRMTNMYKKSGKKYLLHNFRLFSTPSFAKLWNLIGRQEWSAITGVDSTGVDSTGVDSTGVDSSGVDSTL